MKKVLLIIAVLLVLIVSLGACSLKPAKIEVKEGYTYLKNIKLEKNMAKLDGGWEFYWSQLLGPGQIDANMDQAEIVSLPHSWNDLGYPLEGFATYRLKAVLDPDLTYGLKLSGIATAYNLFIDGKVVGSKGRVASSKQDSFSKLGVDIYAFKPLQEETEIIIQVSSYSYYQAGIINSISIGSLYQLQHGEHNRFALAMIVSGILLAMGIYHLVFFAFRKKDYSNILFSIASFFVFMQTLFEENHYFSALFPGLSLQAEERIQTTLLILILPAIIAAIYQIFGRPFSKLILYFFCSFSILAALANIFIPFGASNPIWYLYGLSILAATALIIHVLVKNIAAKKGRAWLLLAGTLCLAAAVAHDYLVDYRIIESYKLFSLGWVVFLVMVSIIITNQYSEGARRAEVLSEEITKKNIDLKQAYQQVEKKVRDRTKQLSDARKELEKANLQLLEDKKMLRILSITDGLTGLYNHNHIISELKREINRSNRYGGYLSVIMLDIDHFKDINDHYGHQRGDQVLSSIGRIIKESLRKADIAGRYGGEEFLIIMPETKVEQAYLIGERLRKEVESYGWNLDHFQVTISGGAAQYHPQMTYEDLLGNSDRLLYQAKERGRNQMQKE
ncbi:MAG: diguanylate cyclase [Actinomycetota bacterium]|nr:diguanylate cyclase [Actinomycetota bacterium]